MCETWKISSCSKSNHSPHASQRTRAYSRAPFPGHAKRTLDVEGQELHNGRRRTGGEGLYLSGRLVQPNFADEWAVAGCAAPRAREGLYLSYAFCRQGRLRHAGLRLTHTRLGTYLMTTALDGATVATMLDRFSEKCAGCSNSNSAPIPKRQCSDGP